MQYVRYMDISTAPHLRGSTLSASFDSLLFIDCALVVIVRRVLLYLLEILRV